MTCRGRMGRRAAAAVTAGAPAHCAPETKIAAAKKTSSGICRARKGNDRNKQMIITEAEGEEQKDVDGGRHDDESNMDTESLFVLDDIILSFMHSRLTRKIYTLGRHWSPVVECGCLLVIFCLSFCVRLFSVIRFEAVIHEFDPYFNFRATEYLVREGFYEFWNWFDYESWYPLGRGIGHTLFPGLMCTGAVLHWAAHAMGLRISVKNICVFLAPFFSGLTAIAAYFLVKCALQQRKEKFSIDTRDTLTIARIICHHHHQEEEEEEEALAPQKKTGNVSRNSIKRRALALPPTEAEEKEEAEARRAKEEAEGEGEELREKQKEIYDLERRRMYHNNGEVEMMVEMEMEEEKEEEEKKKEHFLQHSGKTKKVRVPMGEEKKLMEDDMKRRRRQTTAAATTATAATTTATAATTTATATETITTIVEGEEYEYGGGATAGETETAVSSGDNRATFIERKKKTKQCDDYYQVNSDDYENDDESRERIERSARFAATTPPAAATAAIPTTTTATTATATTATTATAVTAATAANRGGGEGGAAAAGRAATAAAATAAAATANRGGGGGGAAAAAAVVVVSEEAGENVVVDNDYDRDSEVVIGGKKDAGVAGCVLSKQKQKKEEQKQKDGALVEGDDGGAICIGDTSSEEKRRKKTAEEKNEKEEEETGRILFFSWKWKEIIMKQLTRLPFFLMTKKNHIYEKKKEETASSSCTHNNSDCINSSSSINRNKSHKRSSIIATVKSLLCSGPRCLRTIGGISRISNIGSIGGISSIASSSNTRSTIIDGISSTGRIGGISSIGSSRSCSSIIIGGCLGSIGGSSVGDSKSIRKTYCRKRFGASAAGAAAAEAAAAPARAEAATAAAEAATAAAAEAAARAAAARAAAATGRGGGGAGGTGAGLFAALFLGICPSYLSRSVAGSFDNEAVAIFALVNGFALWVRAVNHRSMVSALLAAIASAYMVSAWGGYVFLVNSIAVYIVALALLSRLNAAHCVTYNVFYILHTALSLLIPFVGHAAIASSEHMAAHAAAAAVNAKLLTIVLHSIFPNKSLQKIHFRRYLLFFVGVASAVLFVWLSITGRTGWSSRSLTLLDPTYAAKHLPIIASVSEHQPTTWVTHVFDLHALAVLAPLGVIICFRHLTDGSLFLALYGILAVYFSGIMVRLMLVLSPAAAALSGVSASRLLQAFFSPMRFKTAEKKFVKFKIRTMGRRMPQSGRFPAVFALGMIIVFSWLIILYIIHCTWVASVVYSHPSIVLNGKAHDGTRLLQDDYREAYYWIRQNTHPRARIMSWWDYGYQTTAMAKRTVIVDNNTWNNTHIATVGLAFASDEERAFEIVQELDVDYVFFTVSMEASRALTDSLMYKLSYKGLNSLTNGYDFLRSVNIGSQSVTLKHFEEAYTTENWLIRIYRVKKPPNRPPAAYPEIATV